MIEKKNVIIDAHIHIHQCYDLTKFLNSAKFNFEKQAKNNDSISFQGMLCLTESHGVNVFKDLVESSKKGKNISNWIIKLTGNTNTILLIDESNFKLFVVAGRQIVTKERLEVLALGLNYDYYDGKSINEVIKYVTDSKSIPVIPWGAGKWFGRRKSFVEKLILQKKTNPLYLGDNGNRPFFWSKPKLFELAEKNGIFNLPGSDPLPFISEVNKPGSFGFILDGELSEENPFDSFSKLIMESEKQFSAYGKLESLFSFIKNQILMQIVKQNRK